ncbi:MAG: hypothetical protein ABSF26_26305 [Thermoguttaceae bacterium]|jgi:anti-sigma factor RsiW
MAQDPADDDARLREELVAYLDGELDTEQSRQIEERLANQPETRRTLHELDRTWQMLDELDAPATDEDLTRTTMEMVALAAVEDASRAQEAGRRSRKWRWLAAGGGLAVAALAGVLAVFTLSPDPNAQLLQDLPVLENLDQYRQVDDVEFLRMLRQDKLFTEDADEGP